jgi:hypothetical protein
MTKGIIQEGIVGVLSMQIQYLFGGFGKQHKKS